MNNLFSRYFIINSAKDVGFDLCGVVEAKRVDSAKVERVEEWIANGYNADMKWFDNNKEARYNPALLTENEQKKSLIVCGVSYQLLSHKNSSKIASYAHFVDYHITLKQMLGELHKKIEQKCGCSVNARAYVDSAPILERYQAQKAGFGWIGRNSLLINRKFGSMFFIASLLVELEMDDYDCEDSFNGCGECSRCIESCKSGAILEKGVVDAARCLSYVTIEKKLPYNERDEKIVKLWNSSIFGCDECQKVCPWNIKALRLIDDVTEEFRAEKLKFVEPPKLNQSLDDYPIMKNSPLKRAGRKKLKTTEKLLFSIKK